MNKFLTIQNFLGCKDVTELKLFLLGSGFIVDIAKNHSYFDSLMQGLLLEGQSYSSILMDPNISLSCKQDCLNNLHISSGKSLKEVEYHIPSSLLTWIHFVDKISKISDTKFLNQNYLVYLWNKEQGISSAEPTIYLARNSARTKFLKRLLVIFRVSNYLGNSIGLMLAHGISKSVFMAVSRSNDSFFYTTSSGKKVLDESCLSTGTSLELEKICLLSSTSRDFLEDQVPFLLKLAKTKLSAKTNKNNSLTSFEKDILSLLDSISWVHNDEDQAFFCEQLGLYFEFLTDLFEPVLKRIAGTTKHIYVYVISSQFIKALFVLGKESLKFPHVLPLDNWVYSSKDLSIIQKNCHNDPECFSLHSGGPGYLSSPSRSAFIKPKHDTETYAFPKAIDLEVLNYLKDQSFRIDTTLLNGIYSSIVPSLIVHVYKVHPGDDESNYLPHEKLRKRTLLNSGVFHVIDSRTMALRTLSEFLNLNLGLTKMNQEFILEKEPTAKEIILGRINFLQSELIKKYFATLILIKNFFYTLFVGSCFLRVNFYLNVNIDFRGRFYYMAFPLGVQTSNLGASLIEIVNTASINAASSYKDLVSLYVSGLKPVKEYFTSLKFNLGTHHSVIGLDVSSSGLQILSALIGFEDGLILSNLLCEVSSKGKKLDLYVTIRDLFLNAYPSSLNFDKEFSGDPKVIKGILIGFKSVFTRDFVKYWAMCLVYGETSMSRCVELMHFYSEQITSFPSAHRKLVFKIAMYLSDLFKKIMFTSYTGFGDLVAFCQKYIVSKSSLDTNKGIWLSCSNSHLKVFYTHFKSSNKKYYHSNRQKDRIAFCFNTKSNTIDYAKHSRSLLANYVHFLDSRLLTLVVLKCKEKSVPVYTNHDCFFIDVSFADNLKAIYFSCFKELFFNNDCLASFFASNSVPSNISEPFLLTIKKRKENILSKLESGKLLPSFYILS